MKTDLTLINYSDKAIAIDCEYDCALQDEFKTIGGKFNSRLKFGAGWIFSRKKSEENIKYMLDYYGLTFASVELSDIVNNTSGGTTDKPDNPDYILTDQQRKEWIAENNLPDRYYKDYPIVVRLSGGEIVPIASKDLKTEFWFHDVEPGYESYLQVTSSQESQQDYFINENLSDLQDIINGLTDNPDPSGYECYYWLANFSHGENNVWKLDRSHINSKTVNAVESLDDYERTMHDHGYYKIISDADKEILLTGLNKALNLREKRCKTYLKRYADKLRFRTYWADR